MANKVIGDYTAAISIDGATHFLLIQPGNSSTAYNKISRNVLLGVTGQPADISTSQTLTNKTLDSTNIVTFRDDRFTLQDNIDTTKQAVFQLSGITTATTRTYTLPNASSTLVDLSSTQALTNKTLTSPTITGGSIDNSTITVDSIAGHTVAGNGTVYGLSINSGVLQTANSVTSTNLANGSATVNKLATGAANATVTTAEATGSTSYVDLTTTTDTVTVSIGVNGLALIALTSMPSASLTNVQSFTSFTASGANSIAAADTRAHVGGSVTGLPSQQYTWLYMATGLNPGSTTFKMKYRVTSGTTTFSNRNITVVPL